jgi:hypothetical protein
MRIDFLTMMYNTQNYGVFGPCPSSGILKTREHSFSETGSVCILRWGEAPTLLGPIERVNLRHIYLWDHLKRMGYAQRHDT